MGRKILIILIGATLFSGLFVFRAHAYEIGTHAFLTQEVVGFYNKNFPDRKIAEDLTNYLVDGSRREDNVPRYFHHFYDPVNDRGLADGIYRGQKSKEWAQNEKLQKGLVYKLTPATVASILTASQIDKIKSVFDKSNFTWQKALDFYARGETEQALFTLGHILHLIEDASVPDHTRNDAHPPFDDGGSPYENWTKKFSLENPDKDLVNRLKSKKPILLGNLDVYFNEMATYSNNNFYSRDSIKNYELPKYDYFNIDDELTFAFKNDSDFGNYRLAQVIKKDKFAYINSADNEVKLSIIDKESSIINDYWSRLSTKSVQYGAGLINLFFQEAEKAKAKYALEKAQRPFLARLIDGFGGVFGGKSGSVDDIVESAKRGESDFELVAEVPLTNRSETSESKNNDDETPEVEIPTEIVSMDLRSVEPITVPSPEQENEQILETETPESDNQSLGDSTPQTSEIQTEIVSLQLCGFNTNQTPTRQGVIINEVGWMGTHASANDECIELKNVSGGELDINNWQILDKAEKIKFQLSGKILTGGFYLLERTDDDSVPNVAADQIYKNVLNDTDEGLRLFDKNCNLIDEVFANPNWPAGESNTRRSMERSTDFSWHTYLGNGENNILGTPRKENTLPPSAYSYSGGGGSSSGGSSQNSGAQNNQATQESVSSPSKILITEVQVNPTGGRFIELYNPNDFSVDLTGWYLQRKTQTGSSFSSLVSNTYFNGKTINARSYFVISRNALDGADIVLDNLTLTESNVIQFKNPNAEVVDKIGWGQASDCEGSCAPQPPDNQSIQRKFQNEIFVDTDNNANDFELQICPSPKARSTSCQAAQSNQAPSAFFDYAPDHVVMSEIRAGTNENGAEDEFVELYNPTDQTISLTGWSLKKKTNSGSESSLVNSSVFSGSIAPKSFFLIAHANYKGSKTADLVYSANSNNLAYTNNSVLLYDAGGNVVDELSWTEIPTGQSLERRVYKDGECVSAQNDGEYLGNGCDTDNNQNDFEFRPASNPQNAQSLPEPRSAPVAVEDFNVEFSSSALELNFNWEESADAEEVTYQLRDISGANPTITAETADTSFNKKITEIGREYKYEILAIDQDGLASSPAQFTVNVPSFLESISWFQDPRGDSPRYLVDLSWEEYPFVPIQLRHLVSDEEVENHWHTAVFYYNQEAPITDDLFWVDYNNLPYKSWGLIAPNGFKVKYRNCFGSENETAGSALILPDTADQCSSLAGNHASYALNWPELEDNHLLLNVDDSNFSAASPIAGQDYITAAFYVYRPGYEPNNYGLGLAAIDKTKYYFQDSTMVHQPPTTLDNIDFEFDAGTSLLKIFWDQSTDSDTLDNLITYEIKYDSIVITTGNDFAEMAVEPGATYDFELRAADEFGNYSETASVSYDVPDTPLPYGISDISWGNFDEGNPAVLNLEFAEYPFMDIASPGAMIFFLNQMPPSDYSFLDDDYRNGADMGGSNNFLELSYYPCDFNGTWTNKRIVGGAIFNNADCPTTSSLAMSKLLLAKLSSEDTQFTAEVINDQEFSEGDYITIGFYQLGTRDLYGTAYFTNIANYNKKIYFQETGN